MSSFKCEVVRVKIIDHPNGDAIEIAVIGDYQSVVKKNQFVTESLAVYLPEQAILPEWMLKEMGFWRDDIQKGSLHGAAGNRIKAQKIRGVLSQGVCFSTEKDSRLGVYFSRPNGDGTYANINAFEGEDLAEFLGVTKYDPAVPSHMRGNIVGVDYEATHNYDFDNLKKTPNLFDDGEEVVITEKIHGTLMCISVVPTSAANDRYYKGRVCISSKGMGAKGFVLDHNDEGNLYAQTAKKHDLLEKAFDLFGKFSDEENIPIFLLGEVFGKTLSGAGVQDLTYTDEPLDYRAFDMCVGNRGKEEYATWDQFAEICHAKEIPTVPLLYVGPYAKCIVLQYTDGSTTLTNKHGHRQIREGVVVKSATESRNPHYGRKIAKSVSEDYLLRKGKQTEFN